MLLLCCGPVAFLQALQLVSCRNVRNRDLFVLANGVNIKPTGQQGAADAEPAGTQQQDTQQMELDNAPAASGDEAGDGQVAGGVHYGIQLTSLVLGDDTNKPWVTNRCGRDVGMCCFLFFMCANSAIGQHVTSHSSWLTIVLPCAFFFWTCCAGMSTDRDQFCLLFLFPAGALRASPRWLASTSWRCMTATASPTKA